ncbi:MAG: FkbM family methyltransferase [Paracoccaceae bacterium]
METKEVLYNNIPFIVRKNRWEEDMNVLGEVFSEQNYPIEQFLDNAPKVVFDIGGHVGSFSKRCHSIFPDCHTYTVEPDEENHQLCKLNLENENNTLVRGVLNYYPDKVYFYKSVKEATGGGFLTNELIPTKDSVDQAEEQVYALHNDFDVKHYTLRGLMEECNVDKIDLLKLDCEGGENGFLRDDCPDLDILENTTAIMGEWHGQEDYSEDLPSHSLLFNKLLDLLQETHDCWMHDPKKNDGLGIFGFVKK